MNVKQIQTHQRSLKAFPAPGHSHFRQRAMTRREFLRATGFSMAALGALLYVPRRAKADEPNEPSDPNPILGGLQLLPDDPTVFHLNLPGYPPLGSPDPATNDASVIRDFRGRIGLAYVQGMGTRTDKVTGEVQHLPFEVDLRFMKAHYVAIDGVERHGAFALI
jgi:hypothetical protein